VRIPGCTSTSLCWSRFALLSNQALRYRAAVAPGLRHCVLSACLSVCACVSLCVFVLMLHTDIQTYIIIHQITRLCITVSMTKQECRVALNQSIMYTCVEQRLPTCALQLLLCKVQMWCCLACCSEFSLREKVMKAGGM